MKDIIIKFIPYHKHRYPTSGDYWETKRYIQMRITKGPPEYEIPLLIHEMVEMLLTRYKGIDWNEIDNFDIQTYRKNKMKEPGNDPKSPYYHEHQTASIFEENIINVLKNIKK